MKGKKGGKSVIVKDLMATGLSARKAERVLGAVIDCLKLGLWWGEPVEVPGGTIQAKVRKGTPRKNIQKFRDIQTKNIKRRAASYPGRRRVVKFTPDLDLDLSPLPPPLVSVTAEQMEIRQLASELLGKPTPAAVMATLQQAVEVHPFRPGALLRRLREFKCRGWQFDCVYSLARQVSAHHWL